jgi:hypothetical protein
MGWAFRSPAQNAAGWWNFSQELAYTRCANDTAWLSGNP